MIGFLNKLSDVQFLLGGAAIMVGTMVSTHFMLKRVESDPDASDLGDDRESLGRKPRSAVGTPRPKRIEPTRPGSDQPLPNTPAASALAANIPVGALAAGKTSATAADVPASKSAEAKAEEKIPAPARGVEAVLVPIGPLPGLGGTKAPDGPGTKTPSPYDPIPDRLAHADLEVPAPVAKISIPSGLIPGPLEPSSKQPEPAAAAPTGSLTAMPPGAPADKPAGEIGLPPIGSILPIEKPAPTSEADLAGRLVAFKGTSEGAGAPADSAPSAPEPKAEKPADGPLAMGSPVSGAAASTDSPDADADAESDDVKKGKSRSKTHPPKSGLILIPPVEPAAAKAPEITEAPARNEEAAVTGAKTFAAPSQIVPRPRIFLAANQPAPATAKAPDVEAPVAVPEPEVSKETPVEAKTEAAIAEPTLAEDKPEPVAVESKDEPAVFESKDEPVSAPAPAVVDTLPEKPSEPTLEPVSQESKVPSEIEKESPASASEEPLIPALETAAVLETEKPEEAPVEAKIESEEKPPVPSADLVAHAAAAPAAAPVESPEAPVHTPAQEPAAPAVEPVAQSDSPAESAPIPIISIPVEPVSAPVAVAEHEASPNTYKSAMASTDTTTSTGKASAQLTLGFEITSLQLTPFFKLGAVQLKALSNVVSLHLIGAQPENPLAAGISFQIEHVDLDGSDHLKSLLLKPLGSSQAGTVPQPKLQVQNVEIAHATEGAAISITSSDQTSTAVQLLATFVIAAMDFTPSFEIGSLRLEPTSNSVLLRLAPSQRPTALDLPPSFEVANVQLGDGAHISSMKLTPSAH